MSERPILDNDLNSTTFREYYYLKSELVDFCKNNHLPSNGSKNELIERIYVFLLTGIIPICTHKNTKKSKRDVITEDSVIEENIICSEKHRLFFREKIGSSFSFLVPFQKWLKENSGQTYREALEAYKVIAKSKKKEKLPIDSQFEYNTYIRDFFRSNPDLSLKEAICCWKYKRSLPGTNKYHQSDLQALYTKNL